MDDHVSKLEHMGKETVKKLQDIKGSAVQSGIDINVPDNRIDKGEHCLCQRTEHARRSPFSAELVYSLTQHMCPLLSSSFFWTQVGTIQIQSMADKSGVVISGVCCDAVGEFRKLALLAEADGHLRQKLQQVLKLSKEKWDDARDHAMRAVVADNRMRIWYADKASMELGLLFTCRLGNVDLDRPVGEPCFHFYAL